MVLEAELKTCEKLKDSLLSEAGKFAVISGESLLGVYATYEDALKIGYEKCKLTPFLVKKNQAFEPVNYFTRELAVSR
jgi:hypothetical protein